MSRVVTTLASSLSELIRWDLGEWINPQGLTGRTVKTLRELQELFPRSEGFGEIVRVEETDILRGTEFRGYRMLGDGNTPYGKIAYECPACKQTVIGHPNIIIDSLVITRIAPPIRGRGWIDSYCTHCENLIHAEQPVFDDEDD